MQRDTNSSDERSLLGAFTAFFHHGLLVVEDLESGAADDDWDPATQHAHFDHDSLYLAVRCSVDGPVSVSAYRGAAPTQVFDGLKLAFAGDFESKSGRLILHDPTDSISLTAAGVRGEAHLKVFVNELNWSSRVIVHITPASN